VESPTEHHAALPAQFRLDLTVTPGNAQEFELWRFGISPMFAMEARTRSSFGMGMTTYQFGDVALSAGTTSAATFTRTNQTIAHSGLDNICLLIYAEGGCDLDADGRVSEVHAGDVCILDLARRMTIRAPDSRDISLVLPRALLAPLLPNLDSLHGLILKRSTPLNTMLVNHLRSLVAEAPSLGLRDARAAASGTAALIAAFAGAYANGRDTPAQAAAIASLQALRRIVEENLANPELTPEFLSQKAGVSRATLYRLFEPIGGVRQYIQQRRLMRAYQMISGPAHTRERIGTIAALCGFSDNTVFGRAFRKAYRMSPSELRNAAGEPDAHPEFATATSFLVMNRWLARAGAAGR